MYMYNVIRIKQETEESEKAIKTENSEVGNVQITCRGKNQTPQKLSNFTLFVCHLQLNRV